jgi:hypothetical protein
MSFVQSLIYEYKAKSRGARAQDLVNRELIIQIWCIFLRFTVHKIQLFDYTSGKEVISIEGIECVFIIHLILLFFNDCVSEFSRVILW